MNHRKCDSLGFSIIQSIRGGIKMNSKLYEELVQCYFKLQSERKECMKNIDILEAKYKVIDDKLVQVNNILCKYGNHFYEHFVEEQTTSRSEERDLIDCKSTKCSNCVNHNECEYEPYPAESEDNKQ